MIIKTTFHIHSHIHAQMHKHIAYTYPYTKTQSPSIPCPASDTAILHKQMCEYSSENLCIWPLFVMSKNGKIKIKRSEGSYTTPV